MGKGEPYINRDGMGYASAGTYSVPITSHAAGETFRELWAKCDGAGHVYGQRVNVQVSNIASTTSNAIRAEMDWLHASGHAAGGGAAIHAASELGAGNTGHAGLMTGLNAAIIVASESRSLQGTYAAISLQTEFKADNTMPALSTSFIYAADAGAVKAPAFIHWGQAAASSTGFRAVTAQSNGAMVMVVNVNGAIWYVPMTQSVS